jgi:hypothetical protein
MTVIGWEAPRLLSAGQVRKLTWSRAATRLGDYQNDFAGNLSRDIFTKHKAPWR